MQNNSDADMQPMGHSFFKSWMTEAGACELAELAQCLDDLCDGLMVSHHEFPNIKDLVFKLRTRGMEIDFLPTTEPVIPGAYDLYMMPERQRDTARLLHCELGGEIFDKLMGGATDA